MYIIEDWTGTEILTNGFNSFDDAEHFLYLFLGDDYETDRDHYYIIRIH